jgi:hypothetical protein
MTRSARYRQFLTDKLKLAVRSNRRGLQPSGAALRPHTAGTFWKLKSGVMAHPHYSPRLVPSDFHLLGPLRGAVRDAPFTSDQEVKAGAHARLAAEQKGHKEACARVDQVR